MFCIQITVVDRRPWLRPATPFQVPSLLNILNSAMKIWFAVGAVQLWRGKPGWDSNWGLGARLGGSSQRGFLPLSRLSLKKFPFHSFSLPASLPLALCLLSLAMRVTSISLPNLPLQVVASLTSSIFTTLSSTTGCSWLSVSGSWQEEDASYGGFALPGDHPGFSSAFNQF